MNVAAARDGRQLDASLRLGYARASKRLYASGANVRSEEAPLETLLRRVASGDRAAFRDLYAAASPRLFAICLRLLRDRARAEEALQDSFTRIWQRAGSYDADKGAALGWMTVVTRRIALNELRRRDNAHDSLDREDAPDVADERPETDPMAKNRLVVCLDALGPERRQWVLLAYIHGYSHEELARRFERPLGTMKSALFRGLADLRKCMS